MEQLARNLTDPVSGFLKDKKHLIHDRDPVFARKFRRILKDSGINPIKTLPMAPHLNPLVERFVRSIKSEYLNRMLIFGERHLRYLITEYIEHYHTERPHQSLDNEIIEPPPQGKGENICREPDGSWVDPFKVKGRLTWSAMADSRPLIASEIAELEAKGMLPE